MQLCLSPRGTLRWQDQPLKPQLMPDPTAEALRCSSCGSHTSWGLTVLAPGIQGEGGLGSPRAVCTYLQVSPFGSFQEAQLGTEAVMDPNARSFQAPPPPHTHTHRAPGGQGRLVVTCDL